jgi:hypothetical protein
VSSLANELSELIAELGVFRRRVVRDAPDHIKRFVLSDLDNAQGAMVLAVSTLTENKPPEPLILRIQRAERAGDDEEAIRLLKQAQSDARAKRAITGDGFTVLPAEVG